MSAVKFSGNPNDFEIPDMAAKRRELELQEDLPDGTMVFPEFNLPVDPSHARVLGWPLHLQNRWPRAARLMRSARWQQC
jgi:hypothetical protein